LFDDRQRTVTLALPGQAPNRITGMIMSNAVRVDYQFRGPPNSGNGGYVCGLLAEQIDGCAEVRLQAPPPLDRDLTMTPVDGGIALMDESQIIATARPGELTLDAPIAPSVADAEEGSRQYSGFDHHWFPGCFVCGPERERGDGLRIFAGSTQDGEPVLSPWVPHESLDDGTGFVASRFVWAALDCPGAFAAMGRSGDPLVLGTLTVDIARRIRIGERCVVAGWLIAVDGRKHLCGTAVYSESGTLYARGKAIWIRIDPPVVIAGE
jgi:hypothetical protein